MLHHREVMMTRKKKQGPTVKMVLHIYMLSSLLGSISAQQVDVNGEVGRLLAFKKSSIQTDPNRLLSNWDASSATPCSWNRVTCDDQGRVSKLDFQNAGLTGRLKVSDLTSLAALATLLLAGNSFSGNLSAAGAPAACSFEFLDLSGNSFSEPLDAKYSFASCTKLVYLNLSNNSIPGGILNFGPSLSELDLSSNKISGSGLLSSVLSNCQNLNILNVSNNKLAGFPVSVANCRSLQALDISQNSLRILIPGTVLGKMVGLKLLSLANNKLFGWIPPQLGLICGTLEDLDLSGNQLTRGLPASLASCSSLRSLRLGNNQLSGSFLDTVVSSLTSLEYLYAPFNNITGLFPSSLANCSKLQVLDLSSNVLTGNLPPELCSSSNSGLVLQKLMLANNYLSGLIPSELGLCKNLKSIDLSFNNLSGSIPREIWNLPQISDIVMWANNLTGEIPEGICIRGNLQTLILNNNLITGTIPKSIVNCTNLAWLMLGSNRISGEIPSDIGNLINLAMLQLMNNSLTGPIPRSIGKCRSLVWIDLNSNKLTGTIPLELAAQNGWLSGGGVTGKKLAYVRNEGGNQCRGSGVLVEFEGIRNDRLQNFYMMDLCMRTRVYTGSTSIVYTFVSNGSLTYMDLSYNHLSGTIPDNLGPMVYLQVLNLGHNDFTGEIPVSFRGLKKVGVLDLSHNKLHGFIPGSLVGLSFLSDFDVSNNNLSGTIPTGGQMGTFPVARYENNTYLCGLPLPPCGNFHMENAPGGSSQGKSLAVGMVIGIMFSIMSMLLLCYALYRVRKIQMMKLKREKYMESLQASGGSTWKLSGVLEPLSINVAAFEKPLRKLTFAHLLEATNGFSTDSMIGSGGFGDVYKAQLKDGSVVAIKKLIHVTGQGDREFMAEMETIGKIKHRNLVPLLGYCRVGEERLLVYEYMKWGSLEAVLHDRDKVGRTRLNWPARKKIAIGVARGLAFLHHNCSPHIIHRDMKSSNVLLDENFDARVSDFGMARLVNALDTHLSASNLVGTPGYVPPEYFQSFRCTSKGDVYSYGVVLLELLSGKKAVDRLEFGEGINIVGWAKQLQKEKRSHEVLDTDLSGDDEMYQYLRVALECLDDRPFQRLTMIQVMARFRELQADLDGDVLDAISEKSLGLDESREKGNDYRQLVS